MGTVDYYSAPPSDQIRQFIELNSVAPDFHGEAIKILAEKQNEVTEPTYASEIFPEGKLVQIEGSLKNWIESLDGQ